MRFGFTCKSGRDTVAGELPSAVVACLVSLSGMTMLGRMVWDTPSLHFWRWFGIALAAALVALQFGQFYGVYRIAAVPAAGDPVLRRTLKLATRTFVWGNALFTLLAIAVFQVWLAR